MLHEAPDERLRRLASAVSITQCEAFDMGDRRWGVGRPPRRAGEIIASRKTVFLGECDEVVVTVA